MFVESYDDNSLFPAKLDNAPLVDQKATFSKAISPNAEIDQAIATYLHDYANEKLIELSLQSGIYSRFKTDKNSKPENFIEMCTLWIQRSVKKEIADEVFIYKNGNEFLGMCTIKIESSNSGKIGLIAIDEKSRGQNIGRKLIQAVENYCFKAGVNQLDVVTQKQNTIACKFYENNGFSITNTKNIYHLWL